MSVSITKIQDDLLFIQFSLLLNRLKGRLEQVHTCTAAQLLVNDTWAASDDAALLHITPIRFGIRELPCVRQNDLAVGDGLGEITPPSVGGVNATMITCREAVLHSCGSDHNIRPNLVLTSKWAVGVPCQWLGESIMAIRVPGEGTRRLSTTRGSLDLGENWLKHSNKSPVCAHVAIGTSKSPM